MSLKIYDALTMGNVDVAKGSNCAIPEGEIDHPRTFEQEEIQQAHGEYLVHLLEQENIEYRGEY